MSTPEYERQIEEILDRQAERFYEKAHPEAALARVANDAARRKLDALTRAHSTDTGRRLAGRSWAPSEDLEVTLLESEIAGSAVPGVLADWAKSPSYRALFETAGGGRVFVPMPRLGDAIAEAATILYPAVAGRTAAVEGQQLLPMPTAALAVFTVDDSFDALMVRVPSIDVTTPAAYGGLATNAASQETVLDVPAAADRDLTRIAHHFKVIEPAIMEPGYDATTRAVLQYIGLRELFRLLVLDAFNGDGSSVVEGREQLLGVLNQSGIQTKAYNTSQLQTVVEARALLETASFPGPYVLVMHPTDKAKLTLAADLSTKLPDVEVVGSASAITAAGTAVLAQKGVATLRTSQLGVFMTKDHSDHFLRGIVTVQPTVHAHVDLPAAVADGVVKLTGLL